MHDGGGSGAGDRGRRGRSSRAAIVVVGVLLLLAAGALGLSWGSRVRLSDRVFRPDLTMALMVVMGCMLALAVVLWAGYGRGGGAGGGPARRRSWIGRLLAFVLLIGLAYSAWQREPGTAPRLRLPSPAPESGADPAREPYQPAGSSALLSIGVLVVVLVVAVGVGWWIARRRRSAPLPDGEAERLRQVIASGRAALAEVDDERAAVIGAYAAMEDALAGAGLARARADTPTRLLARADANGFFGPTARAAAAELAELFELARFTERSMPSNARDRAEAALARIDADLRTSVDASVAPDGVAGDGR